MILKLHKKYFKNSKKVGNNNNKKKPKNKNDAKLYNLQGIKIKVRENYKRHWYKTAYKLLENKSKYAIIHKK